jgi:hypothetical protein
MLRRAVQGEWLTRYLVVGNLAVPLTMIWKARRMFPTDNDKQEETISVRDMRSALDRETREVMKAAELRIREFSRFTQAYTAEEISPADATNAYMTHMDKWGDALPGVTRSINKLSDEEITADMNKAIQSHTSRVKTEKYRQGASQRAIE